MQRWDSHYLGQTALPFALSELEGARAQGKSVWKVEIGQIPGRVNFSNAYRNRTRAGH